MLEASVIIVLKVRNLKAKTFDRNHMRLETSTNLASHIVIRFNLQYVVVD